MATASPVTPKLGAGTTLDQDAVASRAGVQQADVEIDKNLRLLYVGCIRADAKLLSAHRHGNDDWVQRLPDIDATLEYVLRTISIRGTIQ